MWIWLHLPLGKRPPFSATFEYCPCCLPLDWTRGTLSGGSLWPQIEKWGWGCASLQEGGESKRPILGVDRSSLSAADRGESFGSCSSSIVRNDSRSGTECRDTRTTKYSQQSNLPDFPLLACSSHFAAHPDDYFSASLPLPPPLPPWAYRLNPLFSQTEIPASIWQAVCGLNYYLPPSAL